MNETTFSFETKNSIYTVVIRPSCVEVTKTAEINSHSQFNALGQLRVASGFAYHAAHGMMTFYGVDGQDWHTSKVVRFL